MANPNPTESSKPALKWRWLLNNGEGSRTFAMPGTLHKASKAFTPDANVLTIAPGPNVVEAKRWDALKAAEKAARAAAIENGVEHDAEIERLLTTKIPRATHRNRQSENEGKPWLVEGPHAANDRAPLEGLSDTDALAIVEEMIEEGMIRAMLQVEKRPVVNEALHGRLSTISGGHSRAAVG